MPKAHISLCFIIFLCVSSEIFMSVNSQVRSQGDWCIANSITDNDKLIKNIDFACSKIDCGIIMEGGSCYDPNTPLNHASVAMNLYYQAHGRHLRDCYFDGSGLITIIDPSELASLRNYVTLLCQSSIKYLMIFFSYFQAMGVANFSIVSKNMQNFVLVTK
ncbi:hypothetical protein F2Q69_00017958 [Brassica cretica]|uniref:X8 domain-containing protein n=1 Tax=Brassica cretica TaxID=69181 RepID=A0A8S9QR62_BRACR|nr:hypothetical protein F2Q69_00017958 [Brassica cretica]